jgi:ketosteroid isomerase-like protein
VGAALDTVNRFYATTLERGDIEGIAPLIEPDIVFEGPLQRLSGADAYVDINRQLLPMHVATRMRAQFEQGDDVCSIYELDWRTPTGGVVTVPIADWIRVRGDRVAAQVVYYDPRPFTQAFGM